MKTYKIEHSFLLKGGVILTRNYDVPAVSEISGWAQEQATVFTGLGLEPVNKTPILTFNRNGINLEIMVANTLENEEKIRRILGFKESR